MIEIFFSNLVFWAVWFGISYIPLLVTQYAIDNYERIVILRKKISF
jgi:hypothetical protein